VHYADALVRMAELSAAFRTRRLIEPGTALAASGQRASELKRRILHLLASDDRPSLHLTRGSWTLFLAVVVVVALLPALVHGWMAPPDGIRPAGESIASANANPGQTGQERRPPGAVQGAQPVKSAAPASPRDPGTANVQSREPSLIIT